MKISDDLDSSLKKDGIYLEDLISSFQYRSHTDLLDTLRREGYSYQIFISSKEESNLFTEYTLFKNNYVLLLNGEFEVQRIWKEIK